MEELYTANVALAKSRGLQIPDENLKEWNWTVSIIKKTVDEKKYTGIDIHQEGGPWELSRPVHDKLIELGYEIFYTYPMPRVRCQCIGWGKKKE